MKDSQKECGNRKQISKKLNNRKVWNQKNRKLSTELENNVSQKNIRNEFEKAIVWN